MRKVIKWVLVILLALAVIAPTSGYLYLRRTLPQTSGVVKVSGVDGAIDIVRDQDGVPHIFATTDHDAYFGLGYVHAQDRMWQLEMNRRIGSGRLSEILGDATLSIDKFQRTMGYRRVAATTFRALSGEAKMALEAYAAGVNAWIGEGHLLPIEFQLLGVKPEPWSPLDSIVWEKMMAWNLGGDYDMELLRQQLSNALGPERAAQLLPAYPTDGIDILPTTQVQPAVATALFAIDNQLQADFGLGGLAIGSNDWVVAGSRTETGKPMLADDPHLGASIPSIWYLAELQGDRLHVIGATLPGMTAVVIGHNDHISWGVTNVGPDVQDLYIERTNPDNPNQVEVNGAWQNMQITEEQIVVKGQAEPIRWAARATRHGPLISDVQGVDSPMALRWTALLPDDTTLDAFLGINYATNWDEFKAAMKLFIVPSQNFVYADVEGNIGYFAPGLIPIREQGQGMLPVPGWNNDYDWIGWIPFDKLPQALNPPAGYIATANNRVVDEGYPYMLSNDWAPPYRAQRIAQLIEQMSSNGEKISLDEMAAIQADQSSAQVAELLPFLRTVAPANERQRAALDSLQQWDGVLGRSSVAATIYEAWMMSFERALVEDDLNSSLYAELASRSHPTFLNNILTDAALGSIWCDNIKSVTAETCTDTAQQALETALTDLESRLGASMSGWQWEKVHITQYPHNPFSQVSYLRWLFHRTIGNGGDRYTVNVAPVNLDQAFNQTHVPSYRHLVDMADLSRSRFMTTTGQSGNVISRHYADFITRHRDVQYMAMVTGRERVQGELLRLEP